MLLVVVQRGISGTGIAYFVGLARRTRNVRLAALHLEEDLMVDLGDLG